MTPVNPTNLPPNAGADPRRPAPPVQLDGSEPEVQLYCSEPQVQLWLRGLLTLAWADGDFDETEQQTVASLTRHEVTSEERAHIFEPVTAADLQAAFGDDPALAQDFLRTAVMVAIADGVYTTAEDVLLTEFCQALGTGIDVLESLRLTLVDGDSGNVQASASMISPSSIQPGSIQSDSIQSSSLKPPPTATHDPLQPVRGWLDGMQVQDPKVARFLCRLIPAQCPFERDVVLFGKKVVHIPPMCKVNPLYEQLVGLRFRSLCYLADDCGEDVSAYM